MIYSDIFWLHCESACVCYDLNTTLALKEILIAMPPYLLLNMIYGYSYIMDIAISHKNENFVIFSDSLSA